MTIRFDCPGCGAPIKARDEHAGQKVLCPDCRRPWRAPEPEDDFDPRPRRPRRPGRGVNHVVRTVLWACCAGGAFLVMMDHVASFGRQPGAPQQAAVAANTACYLIGGYVFVRAITTILREHDD